MNSEQILAEAEAVYLDASALVKTVVEEPPGDRAMRIVYMSRIPLFTSIVGFGEVIACFGRKNRQSTMGGSWGYLHAVRMLLKDFEIGRIQPIEPPDERARFLRIAHECHQAPARLGGGDLWHVMAALELQHAHPTAVFLAFDKELIRWAPALGLRTVLDGCNLDCEILGEALRGSGRFPV